MTSEDVRFKKELEMVDEALSGKRGMEAMRVYLSPFVESLVDEYIGNSAYSKIPGERLIKAGWTHLELALEKYKERALLMLEGKNEVFYFETYFNWYVRQGIVEYIQSTH